MKTKNLAQPSTSIKKQTLIVALALYAITAFAQQTVVNKLWQFGNANPGSNEQIGCALDPYGNFIYFTGHKPGGNCNMSLNCVTPSGTLGWQNACNSCPILDDIGSDVITDNSGNVYACGARGNGTNLDYYVVKFSSAGTLIWAQTYNGTGNGDDVPSSIALDNSGNVYVTGSSFGTGFALTDIVTIKYNNSGLQQWVKRYNFGATPEVGISVKLDNSNNVIVCGSAANNMSDADFIVIKYEPINGNQLNLVKHPSPGNGLDLPSEMIIDAVNNIYIVGTSQNGNNKNIKTIALNTSLVPLWANYIDKSGNSDEGFGIDLINSSEIVVIGYSQKSNNGTNLVVRKYNSLNGNTIWQYEKAAKIDNSIAKGRKIKRDVNGNLIIAGEIQEGANRNMYVLALNPNNQVIWEKQFNNGLGANSSRNLIVNNNDVFVNGISDNGTSKQVTTIKLSTDLNNNPAVLIGGTPSHVDDELIVQFDASAVIPNLFQNKEMQFGLLAEFVQPYIIKRLDSIHPIEGTWARTKARKMFMNMTNSDTISLSRVGVIVEMKNLWPTLVINAPLASEQSTADTLNKLFPAIRYATRNDFYTLHSNNPNDPLYQTAQQTGYTNNIYGINLPQAWSLSTGASNIKIGVFDTGINFNHEDFGNGTFSGSKIVDGKDFSSNAHISTLATPDDHGHGTGTSGIIGALSNNNKGVAGITGGDVLGNNTGCPLYAMKIGTSAGLYPTNTIASAIIEGSVFNPNTNFGYGLHVQNHSWGGPVNNTALSQAVDVAYANSSALVVSSGNFPAPNCGSIDCVNYPASYSDLKVMKVGANDSTGSNAVFSVIDNGLDFVAPGTKPIYASLDHNSNNTYNFNENGTSFSAPHVAGIVGLMMSVHNPSMGAPSQLAPEDVQKLLKDNCTDVNSPNYDIQTGHGRVNAGLTVSRIQYPVYQIRHTAVQSAAQTVGPPNTQITLLNPVNNIAAGIYFSTRYQMTWSYAEVFPVTTQILNWWNRPSSEVGYDGTNPVSGQHNVQYNVIAQTSNAILLNATAFCYNITANILFQTMNAWIPTTPSGLRPAISVYAFDPTAIIGINENKKEFSSFNLYPNPTKDFVTIEFSDLLDQDAILEITDVAGKTITKLPFKTSGSSGLTLNMSHLEDGVYFCKLSSTNYSSVKKFIKIK